MKLARLVVALIAIAAVLVACERKAADATPSSPTVITFEDSGVSLIPGGEWKQIGRGDFSGAAPPGVCLPTLVGKAGLIQVLLLPPDRSDPQTAASGFRAAFDANPKSIKDSFRQESITVSSGAQVVYLAFGRQMEGNAPEGRSHNYIVKNRAGRGVAINYVGNAQTDSEAVHQMIRETLKIE
jgi:hypothetical protein